MRKPKMPDIVMPKEIQHWPIAELVPYDRNPRTHSPDQVQRLASMIVQFGWTTPILIDSKTSTIIAGHGRLAAARSLGLETVPVIALSHLSPAQRRALVIADNKIAMDAGWDDRILQQELESLKLDDFDLDLTGFGETEVSVLLGGASEFIGGEGLQDGVARQNNNLNVIRGGKETPESPKAMAGFWFRDIQVSVPMGLYERFEAIVNSGDFEDRREAVVRILESGMNDVEGLGR